jgi:uncharacterized protein
VTAPAPGALLPGLQGRVVELAMALRRTGVPVSVSDDLDALRAAAAVDLLDREQLRQALAATMISSAGHRPAFDQLFDVYFPARIVTPIPGSEDEGDRAGQDPDADRIAGPSRDIGDFLDELVRRILDGDDAAIRRLAREAVEAYGRADRRDGTTGYFRYRVFRHINLNGLLRRLLGMVQPTDDSPADALDQRLAADEFAIRLRRFREEVDAELRRRMAEERGPEHVARTLVRPLPEEVDFFRVTADEEAAMRRSVHPLARKLATRLAVKRRRARQGRLDVRRTLRRALDTGGVPIDPAFRARRIHRPEIVLLCDVSGSVAAFARFTLLLCHALAAQFSKVRSFAFIDTVDEVTRLFEGADPADAFRRLSTEARVVWLDGHSDYGNAFETFLRTYPDAVTPKTTVLVLGDARNNYRAAGEAAFAELTRRARRVYWLNPEPAGQWGTGDSVAPQYARFVDGMHECRTLRQLAGFIEQIA